MNDTKVSLKNYETLRWLFAVKERSWHATEDGRKALVSLIANRPDKVSHLTYVFGDVLHNPCDGASRNVKLVALNGDINKKIAQPAPHFSSDATPELDGPQAFALFYAYLRFRQGVFQKTLASDASLFEGLLKGMDGEFEKYFEASGKHQKLLWEGFKKGPANEKGDRKPRSVGRTYREFRDRVLDYYYPSPPPAPLPAYGRREETPPLPPSSHERRTYATEETSWILSLRYAPIFLSYSAYIAYVLFLPAGNLWQIAFGIAMFAASMVWYKLFRKRDRAWAALLQGFWVLFYILSPHAPSLFAFMITLACVLFVFEVLPRNYRGAPKDIKQYVNANVVVLSLIGIVAVLALNAKGNDIGSSGLSRTSHKVLNTHTPRSSSERPTRENPIVSQRRETHAPASTATLATPVTKQEDWEPVSLPSRPFVAQPPSAKNAQPVRSPDISDAVKHPPKDSMGLILSVIQAKLNEKYPSTKILSLKLLSDDSSTSFAYRGEITYDQALYDVSDADVRWIDLKTRDSIHVPRGRWREARLISPARTPIPYKIRWNSPVQWGIEPLQRVDNAVFENGFAQKCAKEAIFIEGSAAIDTLHNLLDQALAVKKQIKADLKASSLNLVARNQRLKNTERLNAFLRELGTFFTIKRGKIVQEIPSHLSEVLHGLRKCPTNCPFWNIYANNEELKRVDAEFKRNPSTDNLIKKVDLQMKNFRELLDSQQNLR